MAAKNDVIRRQRGWADRAGCALDARGYVRHLDDNLRAPLSADTLAAFQRASSSELRASRTRPPRMLAVHSSAALVANVFEYWCNADLAPLLTALGIDGSAVGLRFEAPFPTGLEGDPPYIDVTIGLDAGPIVAIESKFTEWLTPRPRNRAVFKPKYFPPGGRLWEQRGLPRCQSLAAALQAHEERFKHLHAAQLLKQALALATATDRFVLYYLYYDWPGTESRAHRAELERFRVHLSPELELEVLSYQDLYRRLRASAGVDAAYLGYLQARYFGKSAAYDPAS